MSDSVTRAFEDVARAAKAVADDRHGSPHPYGDYTTHYTVGAVPMNRLMAKLEALDEAIRAAHSGESGGG